MTVSPGNLDSLLNTTYSTADFAGVAIQSETGASETSGTYSTLTLNTTGSNGWPAQPGETLTVTAVDDTNNLIYLSGTVDGLTYSATASVVGYGSNSLLITLGSANIFAESLAIGATSSAGFAAADTFTTVLSASPTPAGTSLIFSETGSSNLTPSPTPSLAVLDTTTNQPLSVTAQPYTGPVAGVSSDFITTTSDSLNVAASTPGWFIHTGSGNDAISVSSGTNVLDGSTGSNFLTGGIGDDTFFVDDRAATADIWSTVNNFHSGDAATIWGVTPSDFDLSWVDGQGATGYTGLTLHATAAGVPTASLTLAGFTSADLTDGKLTVSYGTTAASGSVSGSTYMYVHAT
jgi:hypothetical protein